MYCISLCQRFVCFFKVIFNQFHLFISFVCDVILYATYKFQSKYLVCSHHDQRVIQYATVRPYKTLKSQLPNAYSPIHWFRPGIACIVHPLFNCQLAVTVWLVWEKICEAGACVITGRDSIQASCCQVEIANVYAYVMTVNKHGQTLILSIIMYL
jgi:hypothetical protein